MLLIVTVGLVLAGIVLLIIGLVQNQPGYIYLSMACAVLAALTLFVFSRLSRRAAGRSERPARPEPADAGERVSGPRVVTGGTEAGADDTSVVGVGATSAVGAADTDVAAKDPTAVSGRVAQRAVPPHLAEEPDDDADLDDDDDTDIAGAEAEEAPRQPVGPISLRSAAIGTASPAAPAVAAADGDADEEYWDDDDWDDEFVFPIEDYDDLRVAEILPILAELEDDELIDVRDREAAGKARGTILRRIETLLGGRSEAPTAPPPGAPAARGPRAPVAPPAPPAPAAPRRRSAAKIREPIPGYESLRVAQILPLLGDLSHPDLASVEAIERAGANRATVLKRIDRLRAGANPGGGSAMAAETAPVIVAALRSTGPSGRRGAVRAGRPTRE